MTDLASRRARVARIQAKQPRIVVEASYEPTPQARERLVAVLLDLLDRSEAKR